MNDTVLPRLPVLFFQLLTKSLFSQIPRKCLHSQIFGHKQIDTGNLISRWFYEISRLGQFAQISWIFLEPDPNQNSTQLIITILVTHNTKQTIKPWRYKNIPAL